MAGEGVNARHFTEPRAADIDDHYKLNWVSMVIYSLLSVEKIKAQFDVPTMKDTEIIALSQEWSREYLANERQFQPLHPDDVEEVNTEPDSRFDIKRFLANFSHKPDLPRWVPKEGK